jgi:ABC-type thiamin/hydroxymethylpyrimidine transport system permease subunit
MSFYYETESFNIISTVSTIIVVLGLVQLRSVSQLPLIIIILGLVGFIGHTFTFLQPTLQRNSFPIYTLCGSLIDIINLFINLFPNYLYRTAGNIVTIISVSSLCKLKLFAIVFLLQLYEFIDYVFN